MEIRLHGRGGQGGVTCAKILAAVYARLGKSVQTFGDYAGERSGAPVRAFTRVADEPITNRNKVYEPDHLLVLDATLLGQDTVDGLATGGTLLVNTTESMADLKQRFPNYRLAIIDATAIARKHEIGTRSVVIVNTTIAGAYAKVMEIDLRILEEAYRTLGLFSNFEAAKEAYQAVAMNAEQRSRPVLSNIRSSALPKGGKVLPLVDHQLSAPTSLRTGSWRSQTPQYCETLAPCNAFCPAGNDVITFVRKVGSEGAEAAARVLGASTPLAGVCGRVCPAPCMEGCNRSEYDGAVDIRGLERWIADHATVVQRAPEPAPDAKRIAIVGGGPAGLSAAYHLALLGHGPTIFELEHELGGVLHTGIPKYRLPREPLEQEIEKILALGVEVHCGVTIDQDELLRLKAEYHAVILATGLQWLRGLQVPGSDLLGLEQGIHFLHRMNLSGADELSGHVLVLGGGNTAMDCARSALRSGAERVTIAYRRTAKEMPAIREEIEAGRSEGILFLFQRQPLAFNGCGKVESIELAEVEMGELDESGRRRPVVTDRTSRLACDKVLLALGQGADTDFLPEGWTLNEDRIENNGEPINVFAAGDLSTGDGTVTHAIGDGRRIAGLVLAELGHEVEVFQRPERARSVPVTAIRLDHFENLSPMKERHEPVAVCVTSFEEVNHGLPSACESERCFSCGHCTKCDTCLVYCPEGIVRQTAEHGYDIDYAYCKGCGICVAECPRCAMEMVT